MRRVCFLLFLTLAAAAAASADVTPAPIIADGMVLQRGKNAAIFGRALSGEKVTVSFRGRNASATSDGAWQVRIPTGSAGGPFPLRIQGKNTVELARVYVGDVWLCSGQSNMAWAVRQSSGAAEAGTHPADEMLRLYQVQPRPPHDSTGWQAASPQTAAGFSAVAYYFGRSLRSHLKVPIGLVQSAVGGTAVEQWIAPERLAELRSTIRLRPTSGGLHTAMIKPLEPYTLKGALWYQGESNAGAAYDYLEMHEALIRSWRKEFYAPELPFLFVQLARINAPATDPVGNWPALRQAQTDTLAIPHTGMVVSADVSDGDIHPPDKKSVGERLALLARSVAYGEKVEGSGPIFRSAERDGSRIVLKLNHAEGLAARGGPPADFAVEVLNGDIRPAQATIEGDRVIVDVSRFTGPVRVLYGWRAFPQGNLYNKAGLPASPFATPLLLP